MIRFDDSLTINKNTYNDKSHMLLAEDVILLHLKIIQLEERNKIVFNTMVTLTEDLYKRVSYLQNRIRELEER